jgi:hypothetical protein
MPTVRNYNSTFANPDRAISDAAWANLKLEVEDGWVALDDEYSESVGLPHSSRWPWHVHKGLYVFTSAHEMHCVVSIPLLPHIDLRDYLLTGISTSALQIVLRTIINNVHDGDQAQYLHEHAMHCADVLRDTIMCNSDDYPLYNGPLNAQMGAKHPRAGVGTIKMCRDWDKLLAWARERSACWSEESREQLEDKFKRCPDGSKPWEHVNHIA